MRAHGHDAKALCYRCLKGVLCQLPRQSCSPVFWLDKDAGEYPLLRAVWGFHITVEVAGNDLTGVIADAKDFRRETSLMQAYYPSFGKCCGCGVSRACS